MPELPEVETIRRDLEPLVSGRTILAVDVDPATLPLLYGGPLEQLTCELVERTIGVPARRGKYLLFPLDNGTTFITHLRMTGRLLWVPRDDPPAGYERARIRLDADHDLRWADLRKFGTWRVVADPAEALANLGVEPLGPGFTQAYLAAALEGRKAPVKSFLLDQRNIAGLGNIYVDEALFQARLHPLRPAGTLDAAEVDRLHTAVRDVIERGIRYRGASFRDYVDASGNTGEQHMHVQVFRRTAKPCYTCSTPIERIVIAGRSTHFCPRCQETGVGGRR